MSVLQFFGVALGVFIRYLLYKRVSGGPCIVKIYANPFINKAPHEIQVGCFKDANNLEELADFRSEINWDKTNEVVKKCAKLAREKDYGLFALGGKGLCLSGADMKHKYHLSGANGATCQNGTGMENSIFVYSLDPAPNLQPLGCYKDNASDRALPVPYANFRTQNKINWNKMELTVNQCARVAHDKGYKYFAVQFYGVCYSGKDGGSSFAKHGNSTQCWLFDKQLRFGVGKGNTNFVYRIK